VSLDRFIHSIDSLFNPTIENSDTVPKALGCPRMHCNAG
jgi:hypothetical protein